MEKSSLFYFRFFLFAFIISQILSLNTKSIKIISIIFCTVSILLSLDIFLQYITGFDIFSYKAGLCVYPNSEQYYYDPKNCEIFRFFWKRVYSRKLLSTYGLYFTFLTFQLINSSKLKKFILFLIFVILILAIIITGERNAILSLVLIVIFNIFNKE